MLFGGADQSLVVNGEAPVVRMTDDLDCRIFHGTEVSRCVLRHGSAVIAWFMDAGNGVVQTVEVAWLEVNMAFIVDDIQFTAKDQLYAELFPRDYLKVDEIKRMAGTGNPRSVLGDAKKFYVFFRRGADHFLHGAVGVAAHDGMGMKI